MFTEQFPLQATNQALQFMSLPPRLYKYEPFTAQSLENLKNQVIYFGSPLNFNDPYDCALSPSIKESNDEDIERIRQHYLDTARSNETTRRELELATIAQLRSMFLRIALQTLEKNISDFLSRRGVSCFSERADSLLMRSHYGDRCKGFCLEFDTGAEPFQKIKKVRYEQTMPILDLVQILCDAGFDHVLFLYCIKAWDWRYEQEWRALHNEAGTQFGYSSDVLTGIYLGPDMPFAAFEIVALILAGQNERVQLWKGERSKSSFSVEFQSVTYTPYLEAKRKGLLNNPTI